MRKRGASPLDDGEMLRRLVALGDENAARRLDLRHICVEMIDELLDARALFNDEFDLFHILSPVRFAPRALHGVRR